MIATGLNLAVLSIFTFCAFRNVETTTVILETSSEKMHVLVTNDLNHSVTVEGKVFGQGYRLIEIANAEKKNLTFEARYGNVIVTENDKVIVRTYGWVGVGFSIVRTHSGANLTEVLGNISISQNASNLELKIRGDEEKKHSFYLLEGESVNERMVQIDGNNITVKMVSDNETVQDLTVSGFCQPVMLGDDNKSGIRKKIWVVGEGAHATTLEMTNGITTVQRIYFM